MIRGPPQATPPNITFQLMIFHVPEETIAQGDENTQHAARRNQKLQVRPERNSRQPSTTGVGPPLLLTGRTVCP